MSEPGKTIETKVEYVKEDGKIKRKTTKTTTTVRETKSGSLQTKTATEIRTEHLPDDYSGTEETITKIEKLKITDDSDEEEHDGKNAMNLGDTQDFREDCIDAINKFRKKHSVKKLKMSGDLTAKAQDHAVKMLKNNSLSTVNGAYGQSLSMKMPRPKGKDVAQLWYKEGEDYDYGKNEFVKGKGNFTQIVWADSTEAGVGIASNEAGVTFSIALFTPPGNVQGQFTDNVKKC